jgi:hypothetical protein
MHLKILRLSVGLKLSTPGQRKAALHLFVKQATAMDSSHEVESDRCNFHLLMLALTLIVSLLER